MKRVILLAAIASVLVFQSASYTENMLAQTKPSRLPALPSATNLPIVVTKGPSVQPQQSSTVSNPATQPSSPVTSPPDVSPLVLKEILSANNQVVSQVASMYQNFGLFITIIVTFVSVIATLIGFLARRSVQGFIREWTKKMEPLEKEMKDSLNRLREAVTVAEGSAKKAADHEQSIKDNIAVLNKALEDVDRLQTSLESCLAQVRGEGAAVRPSATVAEGAVVQHSPEPSTTEEDAEVAAHLQGKIDPEEGKG
jgi:hypothetical protein